MFDFLRDLRKSEDEKRQEALTAYLDGALTPAERRRFERLLASDEGLRASLEEQRLIKATLHRLPRMRAPRNFTLDPARYGRPAPSTAERLYPIMRVATAVVAILFVLALVIDLAPLGGGLRSAQPLAEVVEAPSAAEEAPAGEALGQQSTVDESAVEVEVTRIVEVEQEMAEEAAAEQPAAEQPAAAQPMATQPAEEEAAAAEAAEAMAPEEVQEEVPLPNPEEVTGGGGPPPSETPMAMLAVPSAEGTAPATEGQALEDRAVAESSQPLKATVEAEAPVAAGDSALTQEAAGQPAPSPASRAVPTASVEPAATEQGPTRGAAAALSALQVLAIALGLLLLILIAATLLLRRRTR